ncbi:hypothetical protein DIPPA_05367 [Diplonema papillatum]|nr:hypothetical protein DIPPA_05367 [Diplonema papillatum]
MTYKQFVDEYAVEPRADRQVRADSAKKRDLVQAQETDLQLRTIEKQQTTTPCNRFQPARV